MQGSTLRPFEVFMPAPSFQVRREMLYVFTLTCKQITGHIPHHRTHPTSTTQTYTGMAEVGLAEVVKETCPHSSSRVTRIQPYLPV